MANTETLLIIFIGITAVAVLLQAGVLLGMFLTMRKALQAGKQEADEYRAKFTAIIISSSQFIATAKDLVATTQTLIKNIQPKVESAVSDLADMAHDIHAEANRLQASVDEVAQKAQLQIQRVDGMTTSVLNGIDRFGGFLNQAVNLPIRQVNGVLAAVKAVVDTLRSPAPARPRPHAAPQQPMHVAEDKDLFV